MNLEKFRYNVIIANMHEIYSFFYKFIDQKKNATNLMDNYIKILQIIIPVTPHLASECLKEISQKNTTFWPKINKDYLQTNINTRVVQVNGKKRIVFSSKESLDEKKLIEKINKTKELEKILADKEIIKTIFIKDKLINLIIK